MSISTELGSVKEVELSQGTIRYRERGSGEPIVFVHGMGVNGDLWRKIVPTLAKDYRCITPDWPLGSHDVAMKRSADLSPPGVARLIADFLEALDLEGVTLVGNDTGGGFAQIATAHHPERLDRLILTDCDAFENFPPRWTKPLAKIGYIPGAMRLLSIIVRPHFIKLLFARPVSKFGFPSAIGRSYISHTRPAGVYRDAAKAVRQLAPIHTLTAAAKLRTFDKPALILWSPEDRFFPYEHGWRLAQTLPNARLADVHDSRAFISEDQPEQTTKAIADFMRDTIGTSSRRVVV
jgi:pimeloyl-ACP methyl ester carboxylesterase